MTHSLLKKSANFVGSRLSFLILKTFRFQVDGNILAVYFTNDENSGTDTPDFKDPSKIPPACRLLHKDDVIVVKSSSSKLLDCVQKIPKRVMVRFCLRTILNDDIE